MAKSRNFFGLRRGSTKSHTYSVLNGMQITKDRVTDVANPQTVAQMRTRIAFATVAKAGAELADLVGISFQGQTSIAASRRKFSGVNASKLINQLRANAADGVVVPKNFSVLVPNKYIVSDGTARNATLGQLESLPNAEGVDIISQTAFTVSMEAGVSYSAAEVLQLIYGCLPGDQITVVGISSGEPVDMDDTSLEILRDGKMYSSRVVFRGESDLDALDAFTIPEGTQGSAIPQMLQDYLVDLIDNTRSFAGLSQLVTVADNFAAVVDNANILVTFKLRSGSADTTVIDALPSGSDPIFAVGYFRSHWTGSVWQFSRCELTVIRPVYTQASYDGLEQINYGYRFGVALPTYLTTSNKENTRYTETGGSQNTLGF